MRVRNRRWLGWASGLLAICCLLYVWMGSSVTTITIPSLHPSTRQAGSRVKAKVHNWDVSTRQPFRRQRRPESLFSVGERKGVEAGSTQYNPAENDLEKFKADVSDNHTPPVGKMTQQPSVTSPRVRGSNDVGGSEDLLQRLLFNNLVSLPGRNLTAVSDVYGLKIVPQLLPPSFSAARNPVRNPARNPARSAQGLPTALASKGALGARRWLSSFGPHMAPNSLPASKSFADFYQALLQQQLHPPQPLQRPPQQALPRAEQQPWPTACFQDVRDIDPRLLRPTMTNEEGMAGPSGAQCRPHNHVAFVKVHKAASSTVANVLQRYGYVRGLNFALPNKAPRTTSYNYINKPGEPFLPLPPPPGRNHDIVWSHAVYNRTAYRLLMPPDTVYVSILREPFQQFVSAFAFYNALWLKDADPEAVNHPMRLYLHAKPHWRLMDYFRNKQSQDMGMTDLHILHAGFRRQYIEELGHDFQLVMITEFFDESLVLLRRLLCWSLKDVLYLPKNTNVRKPPFHFRVSDYAQHQRLAEADYDVYAFFRHKFLRTLAAQGPDFQQELHHFQTLLRQVSAFCDCAVQQAYLFNGTNVFNYTSGDDNTVILNNASSSSSSDDPGVNGNASTSAPCSDNLLVARSPWSEEFTVTAMDCLLILTPELNFLDLLMRARLAHGDLVPATQATESTPPSTPLAGRFAHDVPFALAPLDEM